MTDTNSGSSGERTVSKKELSKVLQIYEGHTESRVGVCWKQYVSERVNGDLSGPMQRVLFEQGKAENREKPIRLFWGKKMKPTRRANNLSFVESFCFFARWKHNPVGLSEDLLIDEVARIFIASDREVERGVKSVRQYVEDLYRENRSKRDDI